MEFKLLGLIGSAGCGKDTMATHLIKYHGFVQIANADPIKDAVCAILGCSREQLEHLKKTGEKIPAVQCSARTLLQTIGTDWGRNLIHSDIWLNLVRGRITQILPTSNVVVSDVRFFNEARMIRELGGALVGITADQMRVQQRMSQANHLHESELYVPELLKNCHVVLDNSSSVENFYQNIDQWILSWNNA